MPDKSDGKRFRWMSKQLAGFIFLMAFSLPVGLWGLVAIAKWSIPENLLLIGFAAFLVLWISGFCVWAGAKGYSPLIGIPMALIMPPIGIAMLAWYLPDKR